VDDVQTLLQPDAQKKALTVTWDNGLSEPVPLPATPIRQILMNLSLNAVQAAPEGAAVDCYIHRDRDWLCIRVGNEGDGIPADRVDRLFEPFVHRTPAGHGLGLWVTYQIVQQLNGEIRVKSEAGRTHFTVQLPLEAAA
jgi:signal transduction histidine kinase